MGRRPRILHLLAQRPSQTGSGVTLEALIREGRAAFDQHAVIGIGAGEEAPRIEGLGPGQVHPQRFGEQPLGFRVPGMSDVMPYESTVYASMDEATWEACRAGWERHLLDVRERVRPDLVHSHHLWLMTAVARDVFKDVPVVAHCHATGLRQRANLPERAQLIEGALRRLDGICVLHGGDRDRVLREFSVDEGRVHTVGAGFRDDVFCEAGPGTGERNPGSILFAGKLCRAKGLHVLLDVFEELCTERANIELHVIGAGSGAEAEQLEARMSRMPGVRAHGRMGQQELASHMRRASVFVLPSFYEGLPLVLIEAAACGCKLVATALPGVLDPLAGVLGSRLDTVAAPQMVGTSLDDPDPAEVPAFRSALRRALTGALTREPGLLPDPSALTWSAAANRVHAVWETCLKAR